MRYIDQDKLYEATDDGRKVFAYYYPTYDFGKHPAPKIKIRKEEKTASAHISFYKGLWRITDFGNQTEINSLSAIDFVMHIENLNYQEALNVIEEVIVRHAIGSSEFKRPQWRPDYECRDKWVPMTSKALTRLSARMNRKLRQRILKHLGGM